MAFAADRNGSWEDRRIKLVSVLGCLEGRFVTARQVS